MSENGYRKLIPLRVGLCLVQLGALVLLMGRTFWSGFPLDDAWIHQQIARTFANSGSLRLFAGSAGGGATSYLWALLLSIDHLTIWPTHSPVLFTHALNAALYLASGQCLCSILLADGFSPKLAGLLALLFSTAANGVWFAASGMEAMAFIFLTLIAIQRWQTEDPVRGSIGLGVAGALLFLLRPDSFALVPLLLVLSGRWRLVRLLRTLAPIAAAGLVYLCINRRCTGQFLPTTLAGRRWLSLSMVPGTSYWHHSLSVFLSWADALNAKTLGFRSALVFWPVCGLFLQGLLTMGSKRRRGLLALVSWSFVHLATYAILFPNLGHGGRYQPLVPGIFMMAAGLGLVSLCAHLRPSRSPSVEPAWVLAPALVLMILSSISLVRWRGWQDCAVTHINRAEVAMAKLVARLPPEARVASFDVGAMSYFSGRTILDLGGLVDPDLAQLLWAGQTSTYLRRKAIDYVVLPVTLSDDYPGVLNFRYRLGLMDDPSLDLVPIAFRDSPVDVWLPGMSAVGNASPRQGLYRVRWKRGDS
jgi:hypothetical protein